MRNGIRLSGFIVMGSNSERPRRVEMFDRDVFMIELMHDVADNCALFVIGFFDTDAEPLPCGRIPAIRADHQRGGDFRSIL